MKELILWLKDIKPRHQREYGSKATNLGLIAEKSVTAPGFCLSTHAYNATIQALGIDTQIVEIAEDAENEGIERLNLASEKINEIIMQVEIPAYIQEALNEFYLKLANGDVGLQVAVRSSATAEDLPTASFAGQLESYLNVSDFEQLVECVKRCWASLWTARAIHYRFQKGIGQRNTGMAVIVQQMIPAQFAGVMFTANPLTNSRKEIYIEAVKGLGESLVQGEISGDRYIVSKDDLFITSKELIEQEAYLVDFNIRWLANEGLKLEYLYYDEPQDIEWAFYQGEIYLLQTRPITTLGDEVPVYPNAKLMTPIQSDIWTNINERFPEPIQPIDSVIVKMFYLSLFSAYEQLGYSVPVVDWGRVEEGDFPDFFAPPAIKTKPTRFLKLFKFLKEDITESWKYNEEAFDKYLKFLKDDVIKDFPMEIIIEYIDDALKDFQRANTFRYFLYIQYGTWYQFLSMLLSVLYGEEGKKIQQDLIAGQPQLTMELNDKLIQLADAAKNIVPVKNTILNCPADNVQEQLGSLPEAEDFMAKFQKFMSEYGDREISQGLGGIAALTWRDNPNVVWGMLRGMLLTEKDNQAVHTEIMGRRKEAEAKLLELTSQGIGKILPLDKLITKLVFFARKYTAFREDSHFYLTQAMPLFKEMFLQIGNKLVKRGILDKGTDVMYFTYWELKTLVYDLYSYKKVSKLEISERLSARKLRLERRTKQWLARNIEVNLTGKEVLKGVGSSNGKFTGLCKVVIDPQDLSLLEPGDILVAKSTNPSWTPVFSFIGGLIVEYGSAISHAAIIAREYGIPAVMGVEGITKILKNGDRVTIDGTQGLIQKEN